MATPFNILSNAAAPPPIGPLGHSRPAWLRVKFFGGERYQDLKRIMRTLELHTVCEVRPNMGECWEHGTATFMILGDICTRACGFCAVPSGKPAGPRMNEPLRSRSGAKMGLRYAVVTSVNRDDQPMAALKFCPHYRRDSSQGAGLQSGSFDSRFSRNWDALNIVLATRPDVLNHNTETVPRLYRQVRKGASTNARWLLRREDGASGVPTKTGLMLGWEETDEVLATMQDLAAQGTNILTLGQYLQPTREHLPVVRYVHPDEFAEFKIRGEAMGFKHVEAGPLVRSSYHAFEQTESAHKT
jgi:lipoic acid synthetase